MGHTITIRLTEALAKWLEQASKEAGVPQSRLIREQLERTMAEGVGRPYMRLAGVVDGAPDLSTRKGFGKPQRAAKRTRAT
jgi:Ribbon-helix-helix domain